MMNFYRFLFEDSLTNEEGTTKYRNSFRFETKQYFKTLTKEIRQNLWGVAFDFCTLIIMGHPNLHLLMDGTRCQRWKMSEFQK